MRVFTGLLISVLVLACDGQMFSQGVPVTSLPQPPYDDVTAYEVYAAILPGVWTIAVNKARRLVIQTETVPYKNCLRASTSERFVVPAIDDYVKRNAQTWSLEPHLPLDIPYQLVTGRELEATLRQGGWDEFGKQYPNSGGWLELSAVGFNADKTIAVVYVGHHCGLLCGGGTFHVLQNRGGKWQPLIWNGESCAWAS